ncbi:hypothetical protein J4G57_05275 [Aeromonas caviae]|uniref:hypothetical protein n=1 Tax=Aeromonas caviae TaxID=648 RepID=UPI001BD5696B|nr:hypothetical protein [Aeromonas caviae]MBS4707304.1 hypothetical protein [Aeromonas caviae]
MKLNIQRIQLKLNELLAYAVYGALVMGTGMGLAVATEQYQQAQLDQDKTFCIGEVQPRPTTAEQDIQEITDYVLMKK